MDSLHAVGFADASIAMTMHPSSQLGYLVLMADNSDGAIAVHFKSYKARRVVRSAMAAKLTALSDMFNSSFVLAEEPRRLLRPTAINLKLSTESKCLFDVISEGTRTAVETFMLDILCAREGLRKHDVVDMGFLFTSKILQIN